MLSLRELRRKVKSVKSTQQITKAMKLVAAARLNRAQERIVSARPFAQKLVYLLQELAYLHAKEKARVDIPVIAGIRRGGSQDVNTGMGSAAADDSLPPQGGIHSGVHVMDSPLRGERLLTAEHPFFAKRLSHRVDVVLVTADRGLCGAFNANLIRTALQFMRERKDEDVRFWAVGRKGRDYFRRLGATIEKDYVNIFHRLGFAQAEVLGKDLIDAFLHTNTREVVFIYNEFKSRLHQRLIIRRLLPIEPYEGVKPRQDFIYEPSRGAILERLLPRTFLAEVYRILLESQAAELAARMTAMEAATDNATEIIESLTLNMNKVRQAAITKEIAEVVGGVEALQN
ncbi:MAG: ATP synthase F1 subunit gamma [Elusimicrobia bacterium]|nr:ATP synthase F1 subunit gamma [Candidatus Obscuribacterium magneticum]MCB4756366.1 ATP synthase F1 subunit gamma [Candidatus Obscuribacterium magneticum]